MDLVVVVATKVTGTPRHHHLHAMAGTWTWSLLAAIGLAACGTRPVPPPPPNRWADERLWPLLQAQERRDTEALCALLNDTSVTIRASAALAFASVQDSASAPCLLAALQDPAVDVRVNAVFALGFIANDSTVDRMAELSDAERDSSVHRAYLSAMFLNLERRGRLKDPAAILYYLERSAGHERVRAADALRRLPDSLLLRIGPEVLDLVRKESGDVRRLTVLALGKLPREPYRAEIADLIYQGDDVGLWINAIKALSPLRPEHSGTFTRAMGHDLLAVAALDGIQDPVRLWPEDLLMHAERSSEPRIRIALLGLAMRNVGRASADSLLQVLLSARDTSRNAYHRSAAITALRHAPVRNPAADLLAPLIKQAPTSIERIEAFRSAVGVHGDKTTGQVELLLDGIRTTDDPGMIAVICEEILARDKYQGFDVGFAEELQEHVSDFQLPRDLEARQLVERTMAYVKGSPLPVPGPPAFNHPIDPVKLRALPQGQRYRIVTPKGAVIIATDVDECPGSSLAFDSLVTAGYYNGKAFHRMVPNFVVQGGCPRGDGYGGMPWTLRTEIGRKPFTAGSVGLASAGRDTESCQFFITHSATPHLDGRYTRFGEVVSGMDVVWELQVGDVMERVERLP